jgi:hypothetical protein
MGRGGKEEARLIRDNVQRLLQEIPEHVTLVAAAKTRSPEEILEAIDAGIRVIGENYVQEAQEAIDIVGDRATWHMIGHLQRNKATKAVPLFDLIETVDSVRLAERIDAICARLNTCMSILIEINSGREPRKSGVLPEDAERLLRAIVQLPWIHVRGLMTMGPAVGDPELARPYFRTTRELLERLAQLQLPNADMEILSMGMTNSYRVAIEEGATIVRIGTGIFGERPPPV